MEQVTYRGPESTSRATDVFRLRGVGAEIRLRLGVPAEVTPEQAKRLREVKGHRFDFGDAAPAAPSAGDGAAEAAAETKAEGQASGRSKR